MLRQLVVDGNVLAVYGGLDTRINESIPTARAALEAARVDYEILTFSEADARSAYDQRSRSAHGATVQAEASPLLISVEAILRAAIKRALVDAEYASIFGEDASIRTRFPLSTRSTVYRRL